MLITPSYPKAFKHFLIHPRAYGIQRMKGGMTAGLLQPTIPNKIKVNGQIYERGLVGGHTKASAKSMATSFRQEGHKAVIRSFRGKGWQVFVKFDKRRL